ncbi:MAG TPA: peptidoglycan-binding domain-containing protein [Blastocatellia bacterium]|nr:peptidoglycan-binding domain-containing protein [Blastocatellia bacterium]
MKKKNRPIGRNREKNKKEGCIMHYEARRSAGMVLTLILCLGLSAPALAEDASATLTGYTQINQTVYTSPESIRAAQMVLRDRGYYNGAINGVLNNQTRNALRQFQRERNLPMTGELDINTARALGIASTRGEQTVLVEIANPSAERISRDSIRISVDARTRSGGWEVFTDHFVSGDTLHVYVRGVPPRGPSTQAIDHHPVTATIDNTSRVSKVVFHGAGRDITVSISGSGGGAPWVNNSRQMLNLANRLLAEYQRDLNIRGNRNNIIFDNRRNLSQAESELLFLLYSLQSSADLYNQMTSRVNDRDALMGAAEAITRQARLVHRAMRRNEARLNLSSAIRSDWERLRIELSRIDPGFGNFDTDN